VKWLQWTDDWDFFVEVAIRNGDWNFLEWFVRNGGSIDVGNLRAYIADVLKGKRRPKRPPAEQTHFKYYLIAKHFEVLRSARIKGVEGLVMQQFAVERSTVDRAKRAYGADMKRALKKIAANGWPWSSM
jgi:hypothetical protein